MKKDLAYIPLPDGSRVWSLLLTEESKVEWNYGIPYTRDYHFPTKPTRTQISRVKKKFKILFEMYEYYN